MIKTTVTAVAAFVLGAGIMLGAPSNAATGGHGQVQIRQFTTTFDGGEQCATLERHRANRHSEWSGWQIAVAAEGPCGARL